MRKVLSFVLVLALVLSSFSMAFAADAKTGLSDIADTVNEQAILVNYNLGIVEGNPDGTFLPEKAVNRAEFAAMITRALNIPDSALAAYTKTNFKDTVGYGWAVKYLAFCESKGIMLGDGAGNAMPGRTINTNEAVTMALRAIGYTANSSKLVGVWPANYVTLAQTEGLYDDVSANGNVDKASSAQIIYNLLTVGLVQVNTDGETVALGKSVTNNGTTTFNPTTLLTANHGAVATDEVVSYEDDAMVNTLPYVGDYATVYRDKTDENIIAIGEIKSTALEGNFKASIVSGTGINIANGEFKADDVTYSVNTLDADYTEFVNGDDVSIDDAYGTVDDVFTVNAKVNGKKLTVYSIEKWDVTEKDKVTSGDLEDIAEGALLGVDFATDKSDVVVDNSFELVGVKSLSDIKADNIVYVYAEGADADKEIRRVAVGTQVVEGVIKSFNKDSEFVVDGKTYENADAGVVDKAVVESNVGDTLKLYLDAYGDVYTFSVVKGTGSAGDYGVITKASNVATYDSLVKMITADGNNKTYTVTDDVDDYDTIGNGTIKQGQIVAYSLNKDGEIDDMVFATGSAVTATKASITFGIASGPAYMTTNKTLKVGSESFVVDEDAVVYTYDGTTVAAGTGYDVTTVAKVNKGTKGTEADLVESAEMTIFVNGDGDVVAMLVEEAKAAKSKEDVYAVINDRVATTNDDDDSVYRIIGFADNADLDKLTTGTSGNKAPDVDFREKIQLYKVGMDTDGAINKLEIVTTSGAVSGTGYTSDTAIEVKDAGTGYIVVSTSAIAGFANNEKIGISDKAVFYEVTFKTDGTIDKYKKLGNSVKTGHKAWVFETDDADDADGYDVVIVYRP